MRVPQGLYDKRIYASIGALLLMLMLSLAGCGGTGTTPPSTPTPQTTPTTSLTDPAHWGPIVGLGTGETVEQVSLGHLLGDASQQALVTVRVSGVGGFLNVYVYDQISSAQPHLLFSLKGLVLGDARISPANTLLTAQSASAADASSAQVQTGGLVQDVFREFAWSASAQTFKQIAYTGMYPDLTRWQAEADQAKVSAGQDAWKLDAAQTAVQCAHAFLQWPFSSPTTLASGGGPQDHQAVVKVTSPSPVGTTITVALQRFDEVTANGLWEVTAVQGESWLTMTAPKGGEALTSPVTVTGTGHAFEGDAGTVFVYDRIYTIRGQAKVVGQIGMGDTPFTVAVTYTSDFHDGAQEGIIALDATSGGIGGPAPTAVMIKALLTS